MAMLPPSRRSECAVSLSALGCGRAARFRLPRWATLGAQKLSVHIRPKGGLWTLSKNVCWKCGDVAAEDLTECAASLSARGCGRAAWFRFSRSASCAARCVVRAARIGRGDACWKRGDAAAKPTVEVRGFIFRVGLRPSGAVSLSALGCARSKMHGGRGGLRWEWCCCGQAEDPSARFRFPRWVAARRHGFAFRARSRAQPGTWRAWQWAVGKTRRRSERRCCGQAESLSIRFRFARRAAARQRGFASSGQDRKSLAGVAMLRK